MATVFVISELISGEKFAFVKRLTWRGIFLLFTKYFYSTEMLHEIFEIFKNLIGYGLEEFFYINLIKNFDTGKTVDG